MTFQPSSKADLVGLWRLLFPAGYTVPIEEEAGGQGFDAFDQQAAQFERASEAIAVTTQAYYLLPSSLQVRPSAAGAQQATGTVQISRAGAAVGAITLSQGTRVVVRVRSSEGVVEDGVEFELSADATIPSGSSGPVAASVQAVRVGYQGNVPAERISAFVERGVANISATTEAANVVRDDGTPDRFSPSQVGQYLVFETGVNSATFARRILSVTQGEPTSTAVVDGPPLVVSSALQDVRVLEFAELGLTIAQPSPTTGGRHGWLDAIGRDRGVGRKTAESDEQYRKRIAALPDVVSPMAILRAAARALDPYGIRYELRETRDYPGGIGTFVWDLSPFDYGDACQDGAVLVSLSASVRFFVVCVSIGNQGEFGFPFDATNAVPFGNAWDNGFFDGYPVVYYSALAGLYDAVEAARAAGVGWQLIRDPDL